MNFFEDFNLSELSTKQFVAMGFIAFLAVIVIVVVAMLVNTHLKNKKMGSSLPTLAEAGFAVESPTEIEETHSNVSAFSFDDEGDSFAFEESSVNSILSQANKHSPSTSPSKKQKSKMSNPFKK